MFPVLFSIGPIMISTMGVLAALGFLATGFVFWRKGKEEHYVENELFDSFLLSVLWGLLWSRVGFIILHFNNFGLNPLKWLDFSAYPGMIPLVGLLMGLLLLASRAKKEKWDVFEVLDFAVMGIACGFIFIWLGAFFDGTNVGNPTRLPWGMQFQSLYDRRHPIQIYGLILYALLFAFLAWVEPRYRTFNWYRDKKHSAQTGFLFCVGCMVYGLIGMLFTLISPAQFVIFGFPFDLPIRVIIFFYGLLLLYTRTGRSLLPARKPKLVASPDLNSAAPAEQTPQL